MKKLITLIAAVIISHCALAQCSPLFSFSSAPLGSYLLRTQFTNLTSFTGTSSETPSFLISYGDSSSSDFIPLSTSTYHVYAATGTYQVIMAMTVLDTLGGTVCHASDTMYVTVHYPPCGTLIHDSLVSSSDSSAVFHFWPTTPSGDTMTSYSWAFGDGGTSTVMVPNHTYTASGTYTVILNVASTSAGCYYSNSASVFASVVNCGLDTSSMSVAPATGTTANYSVVHTAPLSNQHCTYSWLFGDGASSSLASGTHTYSAYGTYTVIVTVNWVDSSSGVVQCSSVHSETVSFATVNRISGYALCSGPSYDSAGAYLKVWLIKYNSGTHLLQAVDSVIAVGGGAAYYYQFLGEPSDTYRTKAYLHLASFDSVGYVPTYHDSSLFWNPANLIIHSGGIEDNQNIYMKYGAATSGPGFIGGNVTTGANRATTVGIPAVGLLVYAFNSSGRLMQQTYTDSLGNYSFTNLPLGTYYIHPEAINYATTNYISIILTSASPSMNSAYFIQHTISMTITPLYYLGIQNTLIDNPVVAIYPNPVSGSLNIQWENTTDENANVIIYDITGRQVLSSGLKLNSAAGSGQIDVTGLQEGLYLISIKSDYISYNNKLQILR